jgi:hypothetical protein
VVYLFKRWSDFYDKHLGIVRPKVATAEDKKPG